MAYKKYIKKNGKVYGPYIYHSKRINGKVVSEYKGIEETKENKKILPIILISIFVVAALGFFIISNQGISGNAILKFQGNLINGTLSSGKMNIILNQGELLPANSQILIETNSSDYTYNLTSLLANENTTTGNFYLQNSTVSGSGTGYGIMGEKVTYPLVNFELQSIENLPTGIQNQTNSSTPTLNNNSQNESIPPTQNLNQTNIFNASNISGISNTSQNSKNQTQTNQTVNQTTDNQTKITNQTQIIQANQTQKDNNSTNSQATQNQTSNPQNSKNDKNMTQPPQETQNSPAPAKNETPATKTNSNSSTSPITGNTITNLFGFITGFITNNNSSIQIINGTASYNNNFLANSNGRYWQIISGSVEVGGEKIPDNSISLKSSEGKITVSTNYSTIQKGFGKDYLGTNTKTLAIDLTKLNESFKEGNITVKIIYKGNTLVTFNQKINNETVAIQNQTQIFNQTTPLANYSENLTPLEKQVILFNLNQSYVNSTVSAYKDKYLVDLSIEQYNAEYSYPNILTVDELNNYIERDKVLFLKDLAASFQQSPPHKTLITNLSSNFSF